MNPIKKANSNNQSKFLDDLMNIHEEMKASGYSSINDINLFDDLRMGRITIQVFESELKKFDELTLDFIKSVKNAYIQDNDKRVSKSDDIDCQITLPTISPGYIPTLFNSNLEKGFSSVSHAEFITGYLERRLREDRGLLIKKIITSYNENIIKPLM